MRRHTLCSHLCHFATSYSSSALALHDSHPHVLSPPVAIQIREMAPKRGGGNPKKVTAGASHDNEWVSSLMGEAEMKGMVEAGVLPDRVTAGWRPANGEPYPMPHTDEAIVFEDYFWRGLGFPIHPFLRGLLEF